MDLGFAFGLGGSGGQDLADSVAFDDQGNMVVVGRLESAVSDFDPGPGVTNLTSAGGLNGFVAQYSSSGALNWAFSIGDTGYDYALAVATDSQGNVYIGGGFNGTVDFDPGPNQYLLTDAGGGGEDSFLLKLDRQGDFQWAHSFGSVHPYGEAIYDLEVDTNDNVVVGGTFYSSFDIDPGPGSTILTTSSLRVYVAKFDATGNFLWGVAPENPSNSNVYGLGLDGEDNVYVTGGIHGIVDFDPSGGQDLEVGSAYGTAYLWKLNPSGDHQWAVSFPDAYYSYGADVASDSEGAVYLAGTFYTQVDFDPGPGTEVRTAASANEGENYVLKLDADGQFIWVAVAEGAGLDQAGGIAIDAQDHLYVTGRFTATVDFDPGPGVSSLTNTGSTDVFLWELDTSGNFQAAMQFGGPDYDGYDDGIDVAVNAQSQVAIVGLFSGTADFDPGDGVVNVTSGGGYDAFVCLLVPQQSPPVLETVSTTATFAHPGKEATSITLNGTFTDADTLDNHTATVDWGDGSPVEPAQVIPATGGGSVFSTHAYAQGGVYTVTVTITDAAGGSDSQEAQAVIAGAGIQNGVLQIVGDESANSVSVNQQGNGWLKVHSDIFTDENHRTFTLSSVQAIQIWLGAGDDRATLAGNLSIPTVIVGGNGNDQLFGGGGRSILIGGDGVDRLVGGPGDDLLIDGTTAYDENDAALLALLDEWNSDRPFATRVARLRAGVTVPGGTTARLLAGTTVFDDGDVDRLTGSAGQDWLFS